MICFSLLVYRPPHSCAVDIAAVPDIVTAYNVVARRPAPALTSTK
jgi:hypothetical protein